MITGNLATNTLPYVVVGGETAPSGQLLGSSSSSYNTYKPYNTASWYSWCYTGTTNNVGGTISSCNTGNYSWTVSY